MHLFTHIFYTLAVVYLLYVFLIAYANRLGKFLLGIAVLAAVLAVTSIIIMGCWALIIFLSGVIM